MCRRGIASLPTNHPTTWARCSTRRRYHWRDTYPRRYQHWSQCVGFTAAPVLWRRFGDIPARAMAWGRPGKVEGDEKGAGADFWVWGHEMFGHATGFDDYSKDIDWGKFQSMCWTPETGRLILGRYFVGSWSRSSIRRNLGSISAVEYRFIEISLSVFQSEHRNRNWAADWYELGLRTPSG